MGDRGNIVVRQGKTNLDDVWFYTHWLGSKIEKITASALTRGEDRWADGSYLARIVFCELVKGQEREEAGFGISTSMQDNEHPILVVDVPNQTVWFIEQAELKQCRIPPGFKRKRPKTFRAFIGMHPLEEALAETEDKIRKGE